MTKLAVYVGGASSEIERCKLMMQRLTEAGLDVTSTWPSVISDVGKSNPTDATVDQYRQWAMQDLAEVDDCDVFCLLLPELPTTGAWIELGYSFAREKVIAMAGKHKPIFTPALADFHRATDDELFELLKSLNEGAQLTTDDGTRMVG